MADPLSYPRAMIFKHDGCFTPRIPRFSPEFSLHAIRVDSWSRQRFEDFERRISHFVFSICFPRSRFSTFFYALPRYLFFSAGQLPRSPLNRPFIIHNS
jgi:hypothetical protein